MTASRTPQVHPPAVAHLQWRGYCNSRTSENVPRDIFLGTILRKLTHSFVTIWRYSSIHRLLDLSQTCRLRKLHDKISFYVRGIKSLSVQDEHNYILLHPSCCILQLTILSWVSTYLRLSKWRWNLLGMIRWTVKKVSLRVLLKLYGWKYCDCCIVPLKVFFKVNFSNLYKL